MLIYEDPDPREDEELEVAETPEPDEDADVEVSDEEPEVDEDVEEPEADPEPQPRRGKSRDENMAALRAKAQRAEQLERELEQERRSRQQPQQVQEDPQAEARRLAAMTPEQRVDYKLARAEEQAARNSAVMQFQMQDQADRVAYQAKASVNPRYAKYADEVERTLDQLRRVNHQNATREQVLTFLLGQRVLANAGKPAAKQRKEAEAGVKRQTTTPSRGKGDVSGGQRASNGSALKKRLANITF